MWEKRKEDAGSNAAEQIRKQGFAPDAGSQSGATAPAGYATIGKAVRIKGQIHSQEDLYIDGDVEGGLEVPNHRLTVGPNGNARAAVIKAREVVVQGTIQGDVEVKDKVVIKKDAKLVGNVKTAGISIDEGAYFKGSVDIVRSEARSEPKVAVAGKSLPQQSGG